MKSSRSLGKTNVCARRVSGSRAGGNRDSIRMDAPRSVRSLGTFVEVQVRLETPRPGGVLLRQGGDLLRRGPELVRVRLAGLLRYDAGVPGPVPVRSVPRGLDPSVPLEAVEDAIHRRVLDAEKAGHLRGRGDSGADEAQVRLRLFPREAQPLQGRK